MPGNHDVDRSQISKAYEVGLAQTITDQKTFREFYQSAKKNPPDIDLLKQKLKYYYEFIGSQGRKSAKYSSLFYDVYEFETSGLTIGIAALNSSWRSSQYGPDDKRLIIGDHVIYEAASKIANSDIKICLCHHPLEMLAEWDTKPVRQALAKHFNLLLNGHQSFATDAGNLGRRDPKTMGGGGKTSCLDFIPTICGGVVQVSYRNRACNKLFSMPVGAIPDAVSTLGKIYGGRFFPPPRSQSQKID